MTSTKSGNIFAKSLARSLNELLRPQSIRSEVFNTKRLKSNLRSLSVLGLEALHDLEQRKQTIDEIESNLLEKVEEFTTTGCHLPEILICLETLATSITKMTRIVDCKSALSKLWLFLKSLDDVNVQKFSKLIIRLARASIGYKECLKSVVSDKETMRKLCFTNEITIEFIKISKEERTVDADLSSNVCWDLLSQLYVCKTDRVDCNDDDDDNNPIPSKKFKLDEGQNTSQGVQISMVLNEITNGTLSLKQISMNRALTDDEISKVKTIVNTLSEIAKLR